MTTIDNHPQVLDPDDRSKWINGWGFLDYAKLDPKIRSLHLPFEAQVFDAPFDCIYSIGVIEHLPRKVMEA